MHVRRLAPATAAALVLLAGATVPAPAAPLGARVVKKKVVKKRVTTTVKKPAPVTTVAASGGGAAPAGEDPNDWKVSVKIHYGPGK